MVLQWFNLNLTLGFLISGEHQNTLKQCPFVFNTIFPHSVDDYGEADDDDVEENDVKENDDDVEEDGMEEEEDCGCVFATYRVKHQAAFSS